MKTISFSMAICLVAMALILSSCEMPTSFDMWGDDTQRGFLYGLLHGFLAPLKFIASFFIDDLPIYALSNNGHWYDFGFLLGIGGFSGGIFKSSRRRRRV